MEHWKIRNVLRWLAIFVMTLVASIAGSVPVFALGLIVHATVSNSLTMMVTALLAAICSSWLTNLFRIGGTRSRLLHIVISCEIIAAGLVLAYLVMTTTPIGLEAHRRLFPRNIFLLSVWTVILSTSACLAASRFRSSDRDLKRDAIMSLVLLGLAAAVIVAAMVVASMFGLTGA